MWELVAPLLQRVQPALDEAVSEYGAKLDRAFEPVLGSGQVSPERWANLVEDLRTSGGEIHNRLRRRIVRDLNDQEGLPQLPVDLAEQMRNIEHVRLPPLPERLQVGRTALGAAGFALAAAFSAELFGGHQLAPWCASVGAFLGVLAIVTPISLRQKRLLSAAGIAALAGTTLVGLQGGFLTVFGALRAGARGFARFPVFSTLLIVVARRWVRRASLTPEVYKDARDIALAGFREDVEADARLAVVTQTVLAEHARNARQDEQRLNTLEEAIGAALPHADRIAGPEFIRRLANLIDVESRATPEELVWSSELAKVYDVLGLVHEGDRVLVLKPPVTRLGDTPEKEDVVVEKGEVTPLRGPR